MKQCPNPDCMLYTRLEELPDAYIKCPGCGGPLAVSTLASGLLSAGHLSTAPRQAPLPLTVDAEDQYDQYDPAYPQQVAPYSAADPYLYEDEYAEAGDSLDAYAPPDGGLARRGKAIYVGGILLLLVVCGLFGLFLAARFSPQSTFVSSPEATQIAISSYRPAINTPIAILPTAPSLGTGGGGQPLPTFPPALFQPTPFAPAQQPSGPAPTAPPIQSQPGGGIIEAHMTVRLDRGQPAGDAQAYKPDDPFNLAVQASFGAGAVTSLTVRWYGPDGALIYQASRQYTQAGTYYAGFTLSKSTPWATGDYRADIHTNDAPLPDYSVTFSVVP